MMQKRSPDAFDQWRSGVAFSYAMVKYGDARLIRLYRDAQTEGAIRANRIMLAVDLWDRLRDGEFIALGRRVLPTASDGPVPIPTHMFHDRPPDSVGDNDDIELSGWRYESVKVVLSNSASDLSVVGIAPPQPQRRGPKPSGPLVAAAIDRLRLTDELFDARSQNKRIEAIRIEIATQNRGLFPGKSRPGYTTVWNYITGRKSLK